MGHPTELRHESYGRAPLRRHLASGIRKLPRPNQSILFNPRPIVAILDVMKRLFVLVAVVAALLVAGSGCKSDPGSREYIPGKGWRPV